MESLILKYFILTKVYAPCVPPRILYLDYWGQTFLKSTSGLLILINQKLLQNLNTMKKIIYFLFALIILSNSCSKDHDDETSPNLPPMTDPEDVCTSMDDIDFMKYCYDNFDVNHDGKVSPIEAKSVNTISISKVKSFKGIQYFENLTSFTCSFCSLKELDINNNKEIKTLYCRENKLTSINISKNSKLEELSFYGNKLTSIDISNNLNLKVLDCSNNELTQLDVSKNTKLTNLTCSYNELTSLDISQNPSLKELECRANKLTSLNTSKNEDLQVLSCGNNNLTSLDISLNTKLRRFSCVECLLLSYITIKKDQEYLLYHQMLPNNIQIKYID